MIPITTTALTSSLTIKPPSFLLQCGEIREVKFKELEDQFVGTVEFMSRVRPPKTHLLD
jgi:hypothetical protein